MRLTLNNRTKQTLASVQCKKAMKFSCRVTRVTTENLVHTKEPQHQFFRLSRSIRVARRHVRSHSYPPPDAPNPRLNQSLAASLPRTSWEGLWRCVWMMLVVMSLDCLVPVRHYILPISRSLGPRLRRDRKGVRS